jgi:hypothetical protein
MLGLYVCAMCLASRDSAPPEVWNLTGRSSTSQIQPNKLRIDARDTKMITHSNYVFLVRHLVA